MLTSSAQPELSKIVVDVATDIHLALYLGYENELEEVVHAPARESGSVVG